MNNVTNEDKLSEFTTKDSVTGPFDKNGSILWESLPQFLTFWGIVVSGVIILITILFNGFVPLWLFLFGICLLTSVCVIGTIFSSISRLENSYENKQIRNTVIVDSIIHIVPFVIMLLIFTPLVKRTKHINKSDFHFRKNYRGRKCSSLESNYFIFSCIPAIIFSIFYISFANPEKSYRVRSIDVVIIITLLFCVFCSSYQLFFNWSRFILQNL